MGLGLHYWKYSLPAYPYPALITPTPATTAPIAGESEFSPFTVMGPCRWRSALST
jgi:hypothetical protein